MKDEDRLSNYRSSFERAMTSFHRHSRVSFQKASWAPKMPRASPDRNELQEDDCVTFLDHENSTSLWVSRPKNLCRSPPSRLLLKFGTAEITRADARAWTRARRDRAFISLLNADNVTSDSRALEKLIARETHSLEKTHVRNRENYRRQSNAAPDISIVTRRDKKKSSLFLCLLLPSEIPPSIWAKPFSSIVTLANCISLCSIYSFIRTLEIRKLICKFGWIHCRRADR